MKIIKTAKYKKNAQDFNEEQYETVGQEEMDKGRKFVSVYKADRAYGGPEEGGWWYDVYDLVDSVPVISMAAARQVKSFLEQKYKAENRDTGPLDSAKGFENLPEGTEDSQIPRGFSGEASELQAVIEERPGEKETQERPHYQ